MTKNLITLLVTNTKWIYVSKVVTQIFNAILLILIIKKLEVDIFGTYNILLSTFFVFNVILLSSVKNVYNRFIPEFIEKKEYTKFFQLIRAGLIGSSFIFFILLFILLLFERDFANFFNIRDYNDYKIAFIVFVVTEYYKVYSLTLLRTLLLHKYVTLYSIGSISLKLIIYIVLINNLNVNLLLYVESILATMIVIQIAIQMHKFNNKLKKDKISKGSVGMDYRRVVRYATLSMANQLGVGIVGKKSDYFIIAALSDPYHVGMYAFANKIYSLVFRLLPFEDFQTVLKPIFFKKYTRNYTKIEYQKIFAFIIKILLPLFSFPVLYFLFFGKPILYIFFGKYEDAYLITLLLLFGNIFTAIFFPLTLTAYLKERVDYILYTKLIVIFSILLGIYGMQVYGIEGVVIASLAGNFFKGTILLVLMKKYEEVEYKIKYYWKYLLIMFALFPFYFMKYLRISTLVQLLGMTMLFICYITGLFLLISPLDDYDIKILMRVARSSSKSSSMLKKILKFYKDIRTNILKKNKNNYGKSIAG